MSKLRQLIVCVLLVLLPLQATALVTICPHSDLMPKQSEGDVLQAMESCLHGQASDPVQKSSNEGPEQSDQPSTSCCAYASSCSMCGLAVSVEALSLLALPMQVEDHSFSVRFTSFIPEDLQRPPRILA